jgi:hypothetical protein
MLRNRSQNFTDTCLSYAKIGCDHFKHNKRLFCQVVQKITQNYNLKLRKLEEKASPILGRP